MLADSADIRAAATAAASFVVAQLARVGDRQFLARARASFFAGKSGRRPLAFVLADVRSEETQFFSLVFVCFRLMRHLPPCPRSSSDGGGGGSGSGGSEARRWRRLERRGGGLCLSDSFGES